MPTSTAITWKQVATLIAGVGGLVALAATIHASVIMPSILAEADAGTRVIVTEAVERHSRNPHAGAVYVRELDLVLKRLDSMQEQLNRIEFNGKK